MAYGSIAGVRLLAGVAATHLADADITTLLSDADARIDKELGTYTQPYPTLIIRLSNLLAAIDVVRRLPPTELSASGGEVSPNPLGLVKDWVREAEEIMALFRTSGGRGGIIHATSYQTDYLKKEEAAGDWEVK